MQQLGLLDAESLRASSSATSSNRKWCLCLQNQAQNGVLRRWHSMASAAGGRWRETARERSGRCWSAAPTGVRAGAEYLRGFACGTPGTWHFAFSTQNRAGHAPIATVLAARRSGCQLVLIGSGCLHAGRQPRKRELRHSTAVMNSRQTGSTGKSRIASWWQEIGHGSRSNRSHGKAEGGTRGRLRYFSASQDVTAASGEMGNGVPHFRLVQLGHRRDSSRVGAWRCRRSNSGRVRQFDSGGNHGSGGLQDRRHATLTAARESLV